MSKFLPELPSDSAGVFYGVLFKESRISGFEEVDDTLVADSDFFYFSSNSDGKPLLSHRDLKLTDIPILDHGSLGGLTDDDHTQYSLVTGARAFTGSVKAPAFYTNSGGEFAPLMDSSLVVRDPTFTDDDNNFILQLFDTIEIEGEVVIRGGQGVANIILETAFDGGTVPDLIFAHARTVLGDDKEAILEGDDTGFISFMGWIGGPAGVYDESAFVKCIADEDFGVSNSPGALAFGTTAPGDVFATERVRIDKRGFTSFSDSIGVANEITAGGGFYSNSLGQVTYNDTFDVTFEESIILDPDRFYLSTNSSSNKPIIGFNNFPLVILTETKADGGDSGNFLGGAWRTRDINTIAIDDTQTVTINVNNEVRLAVGTYEIEAKGVAFRVDDHKLRFINTTTSDVLVVGTSEFTASATSSANTSSTLVGRFTVTNSNDTHELQHWCLTDRFTNGFGRATTSGEEEIFAYIHLRKVL